jgi:hypothetical protein
MSIERWIVAALAGVLWMPAGAAAFPGESAEAMVGRMGSPASGYEAPPILDWEHVQDSTHPPVRIHWMNVVYDPFKTGQQFQGVLVVLYGVDRESIPAQRPKDGKIGPIPWKSLLSQREVFLAQISSEQFAGLKSGLKKDWITQSVAHYDNPQRGYDLYVLQSRDGRRKAQMSYSELGLIKEFPVPSDAPKPPKLNLWIQVDEIQP